MTVHRHRYAAQIGLSIIVVGGALGLAALNLFLGAIK